MPMRLVTAILTVCLAAGCASRNCTQTAPKTAGETTNRLTTDSAAEREKTWSLVVQVTTEERISELKPKLNLTAEQEASIREVFHDHMTRLVRQCILDPAAGKLTDTPPQWQSEREMLIP